MIDTEKLYYQDAYLRRFTARVVAMRAVDGKPAVALDRTAFYPTGGGQPFDMGTVGGCSVADVVAENGAVWHVLACPTGSVPAEGAEVEAQVDWARRFDHMQQH